MSAAPSRNGDSAGLERVIASFRNWSLFSRLEPDQFRKITALLQTKSYKAGTQITPLGGNDTTLYVLRSGRMVLRQPSEKHVDQRKPDVVPGTIINDTSFLTGRVNDTIISAEDNVVVWTITRDSFAKLLDENPDIKSALVYPDEVKSHLDDLTRYKWLQPGEKKVLYIKKHWWVFASSAWVSWLAILGLVISFFAFRDAITNIKPILYIWLTVAILAIANVIWQFIDWQNDYYALTDRRVIHQERVLFFSSVKEEAPLDRIQSVTVQQFTFETTLLGIGDVVLTQIGSESKIVFANIANPNDVGKAVVKQQLRYKISDSAMSREKIREDVRAAMETKDRPADIPSPLKVDTKIRKGMTEQVRKQLKERKEFRNTALPHSRVEEGDNIIYRKHWLQLVESVWLPTLILLMFLAGIVLFIVRVPDIGASIRSSPLVLLIPTMIGAALLVWLWYVYEDWRNDIFVVSKKAVIDIDRKPLGLSTQRREATLDKVQAVTAKTRGVVDSFFNVGDVVIKTGANDQLVFERVADPQSVQMDISKRLEDFKKTAVEAEAQKRRAEFREWFHIYDELSGLIYDRQKRE